VESCAAAPVGDTITMWAGLGYNRRAVNLHRCATVVVGEHAGVFPDDLDALLDLPGIGPYTARAVLAFAFERDVAIVDTNVGRVLARLTGTTLTQKDVQRLADSLVPRGKGWAWNQGMLDLGATICTKRSPACTACPVQRWCASAGVGVLTDDPAVGSAAVSGGQSKFEGSDRQGRGRLVHQLRHRGQVAVVELADACGWPGDHDRAGRAAASLVVDGLAIWVDGDALTLPLTRPTFTWSRQRPNWLRPVAP